MSVSTAPLTVVSRGRPMRQLKRAKKTKYDYQQDRRIRTLNRRFNMMIENKYLDSAITNTAFSASGIVYDISNPPQGDTSAAVVGVKFVVDSILIRWFFYRNNALGAIDSYPSLGRALIVRDMSSNGAKPAVADIIHSVTPLTPMLYHNTDRFKVIWDTLGCVEGQGYTANTSGNVIVPTTGVIGKKYIKLKGKKQVVTTILNSSNDNTSLGQNQYYLLLLGSDANINYDFYVRIRFRDG